MSAFTARKMKEARMEAQLSLNDVVKATGMSRRKLISIEANEHSVNVDDLLELANLYKVDIRELIIESYVECSHEQILCNRYAPFLEYLDKLSDKDREDIIWLVKQRVAGKL